ncbi:MAG: adenine phosphoribosyltransferase [Planctomycetes bacterium]|nr:adenine phosphoribosyltransferase [Planctomycetota bacterium]
MDWVKAKIRNIPDFPKPGILFKDITPLIKCPETFRRITDALHGHYHDEKIDGIVAIESRGFIFGSALAYAMGLPFHIVRKPGKLPPETIDISYDLEYGTDSLEIHTTQIEAGERVLIIDDLLATGGTVKATKELIGKLRGEVAACAFVIELAFLGGRKRLGPTPVFSLAIYEDE